MNLDINKNVYTRVCLKFIYNYILINNNTSYYKFIMSVKTIINLSIQYPYLKGKRDPISPFIY